MEKAVNITEIESERRLSFELIMKMLEGLPGVYSAELFGLFIVLQTWHPKAGDAIDLYVCIFCVPS